MENTFTWLFLLVGAAILLQWEVPSCYGILLPMKIAEFINIITKQFADKAGEVLCLSSKPKFCDWLMTLKAFLHDAEMNIDLPHPSVQHVAILFTEGFPVEQIRL